MSASVSTAAVGHQELTAFQRTVVDTGVFGFLVKALRSATSNLKTSVCSHGIENDSEVNYRPSNGAVDDDPNVNIDHVIELQLFSLWFLKGDTPSVAHRTNGKPYLRPLGAVSFDCVQDICEVANCGDNICKISEDLKKMKGRLTTQAIRQGVSSWRAAYIYTPIAVEGRTYTREQFEQLERYMSGRLTSMRRVLEYLRAVLQSKIWTQKTTPAARKMVKSFLDGATLWVGDAPTSISSPSASTFLSTHVAAQHASLSAGYAKLAASHAAQAVFHAQPK